MAMNLISHTRMLMKSNILYTATAVTYRVKNWKNYKKMGKICPQTALPRILVYTSNEKSAATATTRRCAAAHLSAKVLNYFAAQLKLWARVATSMSATERNTCEVKHGSSNSNQDVVGNFHSIAVK